MSENNGVSDQTVLRQYEFEVRGTWVRVATYPVPGGSTFALIAKEFDEDTHSYWNERRVYLELDDNVWCTDSSDRHATPLNAIQEWAHRAY